jgi:hypothetical protein
MQPVMRSTASHSPCLAWHMHARHIYVALWCCPKIRAAASRGRAPHSHAPTDLGEAAIDGAIEQPAEKGPIVLVKHLPRRVFLTCVTRTYVTFFTQVRC